MLPIAILLLDFGCRVCADNPVPGPGPQPARQPGWPCSGDRPAVAGPHTGLRPPNGWLISADSVATLYAFRNTVLSHPRFGGPYPRSLLLVGFHPAATQEERRAAIDLVQGRVIGGMGLDYVVLIDDDDATGNPLWAAIDRLCTLPQVHHASPDIVTFGVGPAEIPQQIRRP